MIASNIELSSLLLAAERVGVKVEVTALSGSGRRHRVKVNPLVPDSCYTKSGRRKGGTRGDAPYQRESASTFNAGRRVHAVCWHGFRDFFRQCFVYQPTAVFRTALDTWKGSDDFEDRFRASGWRNAGSAFAPVPTCSACRCPESGITD